jgi:hypothetical protein
MNKALFLCLLIACGTAHAQTYKCVDARGKVTYTSTPCEEAGQTGGTVKDRMNRAPAQRTAPPAQPPAQMGPNYNNKSEPEAKAEGAPKPASEKPERRCFTTKLGTRCNDDPGVDDPVPTDERTRGERPAGK